RTSVLLGGDGKHYSLGYPEQLGKKQEAEGDPASSKERAMAEIDPSGEMEMFQRLLNSPLGALGRGLLGAGASPNRRSGAADKARAGRRSDARPGGPGAGGP